LEKAIKYIVSIAIVCFFILLNGCTSSTDFQIEDLAKTDINKVSEIHMDQVKDLLKTLTQKLYKMNSQELGKIPGATIDSQIARIFQCPPFQPYSFLEDKESIDAILLGFEPEFKGDRIFAMMYGLYTMIHTSYNKNCDLFILDFLDGQSLYNSARNIEIFVWRLKTRHQPNGELVLITNICNGPVENLSFERIFGKLISLQDTMALIVATRTGRIIKQTLQIAGMAFFPIGIH
jgi:hypothetical protein